MTTMEYLSLFLMPVAGLIIAGATLYLTRHERQGTDKHTQPPRQ